MKIDCGKYILCTDPQNVWIEKKTKKGSVKVAGYGRTLSAVFGSFVEQRIRSSEAENITDLINDMKAIEADLMELADSLGKQFGGGENADQ